MEAIKELNQTVDLMLSNNYKDRLKAEYHQLRIRTDKLGQMLQKYESGKTDLKLTEDQVDRFKKQISLQKELLELLSIRVIENNIIL